MQKLSLVGNVSPARFWTRTGYKNNTGRPSAFLLKSIQSTANRLFPYNEIFWYHWYYFFLFAQSIFNIHIEITIFIIIPVLLKIILSIISQM